MGTIAIRRELMKKGWREGGKGMINSISNRMRSRKAQNGRGTRSEFNYTGSRQKLYSNTICWPELHVCRHMISKSVLPSEGSRNRTRLETFISGNPRAKLGRNPSNPHTNPKTRNIVLRVVVDITDGGVETILDTNNRWGRPKRSNAESEAVSGA